GGVTRIVGDQRWSADGHPIIESGVDDFDGRDDAFHCMRDVLAGKRRLAWRKIARHAEGKLGFHDTHEKLARIDASAAVMAEGGKQTSGEWRIHAQLTLRDFVRAGDLVTDRASPVVLEELFNDAALAFVRFLRSSRTDFDRKLRQS